MSRTVMVTGSSGFLGRHLCEALSNAGQKLVQLDLLPPPQQTENTTFVQGNLLDRKLLMNIMKRIDVVYHVGALADIETTWKNPGDTIRVNILGTSNILEAMRLCGVKRIIFASTLYVESKKGGLYRATKLCGEELIKSYHEYCGINYTILRFGSLYGTRAKDNNGIYRYIKEAFEGKINHWGTGEEVREFINVKDVADLCVQLLNDEHLNETLIFTGYHRYRVREVLEMIKEIIGKEIEIAYHPEDNRTHYTYTPYSYLPKAMKRINPLEFRDFGASLVEIMEEINAGSDTLHKEQP